MDSAVFSVGDSEGPVRLEEFVARECVCLSKGRLRRLISAGQVELNGQRATRGKLCQPGDTVRIHLPEEQDYEPEPLPVDVLYEDPSVVVVNKPPGIAVVPERHNRHAAFINALLYYFQHDSPLREECRDVRPRIVHRLDRDASGALLVAREAAAERALARAFERQEIEKQYLALVSGRVAELEGLIDLPVGTDPKRRSKMRAGVAGGRHATSLYRVLETFREHTLLEVSPKTGRTHQIRVHLKALGHPLAVDPLYGKAQALYQSDLAPGHGATGRQQEPPLISRLTLHCHRLRFVSPATGEEIESGAPLHDDFAAALDALKRYASE